MHCYGLTTGLLLVLVSAVAADTSLWIPDTDPQPISAGVLGVGSDGRTTWQLQQGTATGTEFTDPADEGFPGTATLVEGPSDAVITLAQTETDPDTGSAVTAILGLSCSISNSIAACVGVGSEGPLLSTGTETETVSPFLVQGGGTVSGASNSGSTATAASSSPTQAASSQASAGSTPASSGAQPTGSTTGKNAAQKHHVTGGLLLGLMAAAVGSVFVRVV